MYCDIQGILSKAQAVPIIGPFVFSPLKAVVSLAQVISGLALNIIFKVVSKFAELNQDCELAWRMRDSARNCLAFAKNGANNLIYAGVNLISFGAIGLAIELNKWKFELIHANWPSKV